MTFKNLKAGKLYNFTNYYLITDKTDEYFYYYEYSIYEKKWFIGSDTFDKFNHIYMWKKLKLRKIQQNLKYEMIKNLFKYGINNE